MSLTIYPYTRDPENGNMVDRCGDMAIEYNELFGLESWRYTVWGASICTELGCKLLTTLKYQNIYAEQAVLDTLEKELCCIRNNLGKFVGKNMPTKAAINHRINNGLEAIRVAKKYLNGGVCIA